MKSPSRLDAERGFPAIVHARGAGSDVAGLVHAHREELEALLLETGAILFRGFAIDGTKGFAQFCRAIHPNLIEYEYRSTPRTAVGDDVYTATEYPAQLTIPMHCEHAYARDWPMKLMMYCPLPAVTGGETPLARVREVTAALGPKIVDLFAEREVTYVRNYGPDVDLPWQSVFQTRDRAAVESYCGAHGIAYEWRGEDELRTRQRCQGAARHPRSGERLFFNQAHLFHVSSHDPKTRAAMIDLFGAEGLPRNAYFGDGSPIPEGLLAEVRGAFDAARVARPWRANDVVVIDNMLVAHGRLPFTGARKVFVAMSETLAA